MTASMGPYLKYDRGFREMPSGHPQNAVNHRRNLILGSVGCSSLAADGAFDGPGGDLAAVDGGFKTGVDISPANDVQRIHCSVEE